MNIKIAHKAECNRFLGQAGQAMVEFALLLLVIMTLCAGMLYVSRLLTFQFWAQQESRLVAFNLDWVAQSGGIDEYAIVSDGAKLHQPKVVRKLDSTHNGANDGSISTLLTSLTSDDLSAVQSNVRSVPISEISDSGVMLASNRSSLWFSRTKDWLRGIDRKLQVIDSAFAIQGRDLTGEIATDDLPEFDALSSAEKGFIALLERVNFGNGFCRGMSDFLSGRGFDPKQTVFSGSECDGNYNFAFGRYLARNFDMPNFTREYGLHLQSGVGPGPALQATIEEVVASEFYSFFDNTVKQQFPQAPDYISDHQSDSKNNVLGNDYDRMVNDARYIGASNTLSDIKDAINKIINANESSHSWQDGLSLENEINNVLYADGDSSGLGGQLGSWLSLSYLPVPPTLSPAAGGIFAGPMRNALANESSDYIDEQIDQSNKMVRTTYEGDKGLLGVARRRFSANKTLESRFYLVTQPWHIERREGGTGDYRELGGQFDLTDQPTDEGVLRRRIQGLWLLPSDPGAFLQPLLDLMQAAGAPDLSGVTDVMSVVKEPLQLVKDLIGGDNFINKLFITLKDFAGIDLSLPLQPAVRPVVYPNTVELKDDKLMGGSPRDFGNYISEQKDWKDVKPDPEFDD